MIYNYSISSDTLNGKVGDSLEQSIKEANIIFALEGYTVAGDSLTITFKGNLSSQEEIDLDAVVSAHDGSNLQEEIIAKYQEVLPQGGQRVTDRGFQFNAVAGQMTSYDFVVTEDLFVKEGFAIAYDFEKTDSVSMSIVHPLYGPLHYYLKDMPLEPHMADNTVGRVDASNKAITETNFNGLTIRMTYNSTGASDVHCCVTMRTYS